MPSELTAYRVFIASPGGLIEERKSFRDVIAAFNESDAIHRNAHFVAVGWEATLGGVGRPQALINQEVESCDYFLLLLWDRWGTPPDTSPDGRFTSGTEEEYNIALNCFDASDRPMRQIVAFFKAVDERRLSDPGDQLKTVLQFKKKLEQEKTMLFHTFDELHNFEHRLRCHLAHWLRDHESGGTTKVRTPSPLPSRLPSLGSTELQPSPPQPPSKSEEKTPTSLGNAERLSAEGRLTEAEALFAKAVARGDDSDAFNRYGLFLHRIGRLAQAQVCYERALELSTVDEAGQARAYTNLADVYYTRGDLDAAEAMLKKSLSTNEKLGRLEGMASQFGNLGNLYATRGDLDAAEAMLKKSLSTNEKLGRLEDMAMQYGNLGTVYGRRGDLDAAEEMFKKSLDTYEELRHMEGMANAYCNLGNVYRERGDLGASEAMLKKSLAMYEKLGRPKSIAITYGSLGLVYATRGYRAEAEEMFRKSLSINEELDHIEGMAHDYTNLGSVYRSQGDLEATRACWDKARDLFAKLGVPHMVKKMQSELDSLPPPADTPAPP